MTASSYLSFADSTTDALFKAWAKPISDFLQSAACTGFLTKTTDTGQINWATVITPTVNTQIGYEIYKLTDAIGAAQVPPIYMKVMYGISTPLTTTMLTIQFGTGTNGAGTLTGQLSTNWSSLTPGGAANVVQYPTYMSCDGASYLMINLHNGWGNNPGAGTILVIERTRNADNTPNSDGLTVLCGQMAAAGAFGVSSAGQGSWQTYSWALGTPQWGVATTGQPPIGGDSASWITPASLSVGATAYTLPVLPTAPRPQPGQASGLLAYMRNDIAPRAQFSQVVNGRVTNYLATATQTSNVSGQEHTNAALAVRYD